MIIMIPSMQSHKPRRRKARVTQAGPAPLALVSAVYDENLLRLTLGFDRPVDIDAFVGSAVVVNDPVLLDSSFDGTGGASLLDATTVEITLNSAGSVSGTTTRLIATDGTGILATDDAGEWAGAVDLALPFP